MKPMAFFAVFFLAGISLNAQESKWSAGPIGFLGQSKFTHNDSPSEYLNQLAYQVGGFCQYTWTKRLSVRMGLSYSMAKGGYKGQVPGITFPGLPTLEGEKYEVQFERSDLVVPIDLMFDLGKAENKGLYLLFGPALGIKLQRKTLRTVYLPGSPEQQTYAQSANYPRVDLMGSLGLGYAFQVGSKSQLFVQPRLSTNIPGNVLDFLRQDKGGETNHVTVYWYGVDLGVSTRF